MSILGEMIKVSTENILNSVNNISLAQNFWKGVKVPSESDIGNCTGAMAEQLKEVSHQCREIHYAVDTLLENTIEWGKTVQVKFEKVDSD